MFETEEGVTRANMLLEWAEKEGKSEFLQFLKEPMDITPASEPSDIIWENRHFSTGQRRCKSAIVMLIIAILLSLSASTIFYCSKYSNMLKGRYPKTNCKSIT